MASLTTNQINSGLYKMDIQLSLATRRNLDGNIDCRDSRYGYTINVPMTSVISSNSKPVQFIQNCKGGDSFPDEVAVLCWNAFDETNVPTAARVGQSSTSWKRVDY